MESETEIRNQITKITESYQHVLDCGPATIGVNAPRALLQLAAVAKLDSLYWVLGKSRPNFTCDDFSKTDY